ncbi:hypothetical protein HOY82DRAFT_646852 [Tuber indicum]|nr:hypothetical protein HOY82DRAFT_646852 [Tuber indicum]
MEASAPVACSNLSLSARWTTINQHQLQIQSKTIAHQIHLLCGTRLPDQNNNHSSPLAISTTTPTSVSKNNDSVSASSTTPAPVNAPCTVVPVHRPIHKGNETVANKTKGLPWDIAGQLEDRIAEDPKADIDAWLALIEEQMKKGKMDDFRAVYERFFLVFPAAWISYVKMELANNELHVERILQMSLFNVANVELWSISWQDQEKMDTLPKVYQRAVTMPVQGVELLWKEYNQFEQGLNKLTAREYLQEYSPMFVTARYCLIELSNITKGLRLETLSCLPPAPGYEVGKGRLLLAKEDPAGLRTSILYDFNQPLMGLRFWPEMRFDAAEWCFANGIDSQGVDLLNKGMVVNPKSCLLYFKYADKWEPTAILAGVRTVERKEKEDLALIGDAFKLNNPYNAEDIDADDDPTIAATRAAKDAQLQVMPETISTVWINLMRAMGHVQGHGKVNEPLGGNRQIFADAMKRGNINSDVYVASALIECHCYKHLATLKIFVRGMRIFPEDENFVLEYLKFLVAINDLTNPVFSRFSSRYAYKAVDPCASICVVSTAQQCKLKSKAISPPDLDHITRDGRDYLNHSVSPTSGTSNGPTLSQTRPPNEDLSDPSEQLQPHHPQSIKMHEPPGPTELPNIIRALLSILPGPEKYPGARLKPEAIVELLRNLNLPNHV